MGKITHMTFSSSLSDLCEVNSSFDSGKLRICYTGGNQNGSYISKEAIEKSIKTIYNCPIVCNYDRQTDSLGGHDIDLVKDDDGNIRIVNITQPVGVIPQSANVWFDKHTDENGVEHEYLYADALIWKRQEAYQKIKRDGITSHSMQINVKDGHDDQDGYYHIDNFEFNAFALISKTPCFEDSALELFSKKDFKDRMTEMMDDMKKAFNLVNAPQGDDNNKNSKEGGSKALEDKMKLLADNGIDASTLDFAIDDVTFEELKKKIEEISVNGDKGSDITNIDGETNSEPTANANGGSDGNNDGEGQSEGNDDGKTFELNNNILDEIEGAIKEFKVPSEWDAGRMVPRYSFADYDPDVSIVYLYDRCEGWHVYSYNYTMNGDHVVIDFNSKKRMKIAYVDFNEGDVQPVSSPVANVFSAMTDEMKKMKDFESKYNESLTEIDTLKGELKELKDYKYNVEQNIVEQQREEVFSKFEDLKGLEEFEALKENKDIDIDALEEKCYAIRGKHGTPINFSKSGKSLRFKVDKNNETNDKDEPYGGIFEKYHVGSNN